MLHYVALMWNDSHRHEANTVESISRHLRSTRSGWRTTVDVPGLVVFTQPLGPTAERTYPLTGQRGVVIGRVFERDYEPLSTPAEVEFDETVSSGIVASGCRSLLENYWGRYVAFVRDPHAGSRWVLRDPTGLVLCFATVVDGIDVYFCRLADCSALAIRPKFTVNWKYLRGYCAYGRPLINETGLNEVLEVLPGERLAMHRDTRSSSFEWNPLQIAQSEAIEDAREAIGAMRKTVRRCVHAWSAGSPGILHYLSGGLDSSIVLSCLKDAPTQPRVTALNYYSPGSDTDERCYARAAAAAAGFPLVEWERNANYSIAPLLTMPAAPWPCWALRELESGQAERRLADDRGASAIFSGYGGDTLFYCGGPVAETVDYIRRRGFRSLLTVALDVAHLHGSSLWNVLRTGVRYGAFRRPWDMRSLYGTNHTPALAASVVDAVMRDHSLLHPLLRSIPDIPLGKLCHVYAIMLGQSIGYDPLECAEDPTDVRPLCSQPMMDLSLRIPVYLLIVGGRDRAIARAAFASDLPAAILHRRTKGGMDEHAKNVLNRNLDVARELLLDGVLVREKYIDGESIENALAGRPTRVKVRSFDLFSYLIVEAWLHSCEQISLRDIAA